MKRLPFILLAIMAFATVVSSCNMDNDNYWTQYEDWRNDNNAWIAKKEAQVDADGKKFYTKIVPVWNSQAYVLMHYYNDTMLTKDNLKPLPTSTVDVKYIGRTFDDVKFDSSFLNTAPADSLYRAYLPNMVKGWTIALTNMHVGDSVEVIIPYDQAYGSTGQNSISPYSHLTFGIKLVNIAGYEVRP